MSNFFKTKSIDYYYKETSVNMTGDFLPHIKTMNSKVTAKQIAEDAPFLIGQLDELIKGFSSWTDREREIFAMNVYWLTKYGFIKDDDMNGINIA